MYTKRKGAPAWNPCGHLREVGSTVLSSSGWPPAAFLPVLERCDDHHCDGRHHDGEVHGVNRPSHGVHGGRHDHRPDPQHSSHRDVLPRSVSL